MENNNTITFLGTGTSQGIPVAGSDHPVGKSSNLKDKRLRTSVMINVDSNVIVIDCGPDFRYQMLRENVQNVDAILFTHEHSDHIAGLDDIRPYYFKLDGNMPIYAQPYVLESIKKRFDYIFKVNKYPGVPGVDPVEIISERFNFKSTKIIPLYLKHGKLDVLGFRIQNIVYITDCNYIPEKEYSKLKDVDILVINALRLDKHHSHFSLNEALEVVEKIKPSKAYLTHISQYLGFHDDVEKSLPENVYLAYDQLELQF